MGTYKIVRDSRGRYTIRTWLRYKTMQFMVWVRFCIKVSGAVTVVMWLMLGSFLVGNGMQGNRITFVSTAFAGTIAPDKITEAENIVIDEISACETKGVKEPDGAIILDSNNRMSVGAWMYQIQTVQQYVKERDGTEITRAEAIQLATTHEKAKELTRYILFTDKGWSNWQNCSNQLGTASKVGLINKIAN